MKTTNKLNIIKDILYISENYTNKHKVLHLNLSLLKESTNQCMAASFKRLTPKRLLILMSAATYLTLVVCFPKLALLSLLAITLILLIISIQGLITLKYPGAYHVL